MGEWKSTSNELKFWFWFDAFVTVRSVLTPSNEMRVVNEQEKTRYMCLKVLVMSHVYTRIEFQPVVS
jgi:hypothetical protein